MQRELTTQQIENIQIDYGMVYINFGTVGERRIGPTKGGATFTLTKTLRDIEFDGAIGKSKGMQVVDDINAMLSISSLDTSMDDLAIAMPWADYASDVITAKSSNIGVVADSAYLTNVTMFAKLVGGSYKKITLYNAMNESDFSLQAAPKAEGTVSMEINAHWDPTDDTVDLFEIEDVETMGNDVAAPTVITVPADAASNVVITADLTATFNEAIRESDITTNNFILIKASDGTIVAGALTYVAATKTATFNPTGSLDAGTAYIWTITNVRDTAGNAMTTVVKNFTTAS
jgi:hypothetical protein